MQVSGYRGMWLLTMFDLPVDTKQARKNYARFRKFLLTDGFAQMQFSIYSRHCASEENATVHMQRVERRIPPDGEVRIKQFERMRIFWGKTRHAPELPSRQLELF